MNSPASLCDHWLKIVRERSAVLDKTLDECADMSVTDYLGRIFRFSEQSYQSRTDLGEVLQDYITPLLGHQLAEQAAEDITRHPVALTANHHGVDYFAQSVQGSVLFGMGKKHHAKVRTAPVFACGNVPLDNITYPRGALIYRPESASQGPQKLPVFSNKVRRQPVSLVNGVDRSKVNEVIKRVSKADGAASGRCRSLNSFLRILEEDYGAEDSFRHVRYSDQSVIINHRIWKRMFDKTETMPSLITLELEEVARRLLLKDLENSSSLIYQLLFRSDVRERLISVLDGVTGCWNISRILARLEYENSATDLKTDGTGTFAFWGIDEANRRVPLFPDQQSQGAVLQGITDNAQAQVFPFEPDTLIKALRNRELLPSLFSCFTVIALARGVTCLGGYYQAEYLPAIQKGVVQAVQAATDEGGMKHVIGASYTEGYLSGMQLVMIGEDPIISPAGPLEIIHGGALSENDLKKMGNVSVGNAHLASLLETISDVLPKNELTAEGTRLLLKEQYCRLSGSVLLRH